MKNIFLWMIFFIFPTICSAQSTISGQLAVSGENYSHVIMTVGRNSNPLNQDSQVAIYAGISCNYLATHHCAGFETGIGIDAGATVDKMEAYTVGNIAVGAGATITRYKTYAFADDSPGVNNAVFASQDDDAFTGNWFIKYNGTRPSSLGGALSISGDLGVGRTADPVTDARTIACDATAQCFVRLYVGGVEKGRFTVSSAGLQIDSFSGPIKMPSLAGSGTRAVMVDSAGNLSAP